jgi:hypothetical protein
MDHSAKTFVLAPFSVAGHPVHYECPRNGFSHNISCAILVRHFLMAKQMDLTQTVMTAELASAVFQSGLNEMIARFASMPSEIYLDVLAKYLAEANADTSDPWLQDFFNAELMRCTKDAAPSIVHSDPSLIHASQVLIGESGSKPQKAGKERQRKLTRKQRNQQKRLMRALDSAL